ncbi:Lysophospholipase 1 [Exophiala xenobiotica]|uniref:Lysophospholipase n=1 Tax=Lithohypha guttulata TaxID=1690604 RepID=A0ABR0JX87_9EURO|nr:Lysophospholipase 1 [Lithohypha guttulata]KAK5316594.1 Lysophospholipase 1 [Exophiala xenobiotica]
MKFTTCAAVLGSAANIAQGAVVSPEVAHDTLTNLRRALPNSPKGYTPSEVDCPSTAPSVRLADSLSQNETEWVQRRRNNTIEPMREFLSRMNISNFDAGQYIDDNRNNASALPNIGIAFSGGGWRALINGAGVLSAFDSRTENSTNSGQLGGLLQSATYIAGLSGGNWLVGSIYVNNFTTVTALRDDPSVWQFENNILEGPPSGGIQLFNTAGYYTDIYNEVQGKRDAGFDASLTDYWGRAISSQLINATEGGPAYTWSSIALTEGFQNAEQPFPISIADARAPGQKIVSLNSSVYEFNPFEMGTWDPTTYGFIPTRYLGTNMTNGSVVDNSRCTIGFDNAGFIMGTSSSLFNTLILQLNDSSLDIPDILRSSIGSLLQGLGRDSNDIADYDPNPFYGWNPTGNASSSTNRSLTLVDGGLDNQNIPLNPLIQPVREVDVIFANDNSADTPTNWPNGSSLVQTYMRSQSPIGNGTAFPSIPDTNTFINLGLNNRPTFFGCDASNITSSRPSLDASNRAATPPLIVYIPNSPYVTFSNQPTTTLETNNTYRDAMIRNGYEVATMANGTLPGYENWPQCVACAILSRSFDRTGTEVPQACQDCFAQYCWDGTLNSTDPGSYSPEPRLSTLELDSAAASSAQSSLGVVAVAAVGSVLALTL